MPEYNLLVKINCAECKHEMIKWDTGYDYEHFVFCNTEKCSLRDNLFEITGFEINVSGSFSDDVYSKEDIPKEDAFKELLKKAKEIRRLGDKII